MSNQNNPNLNAAHRRTSYVVSPPRPRRISYRYPSTRPRGYRRDPGIIRRFLRGVVGFFARYVCDVLASGILLLRIPLSYLLCVIFFCFICLLIVIFIAGSITTSLGSILQPMCVIPGLSRFSMCSNVVPTNSTSTVSSALESVFQPLCSIPRLHNSYLCNSSNLGLLPAPETPVTRWADYPHLMEIQTRTFEQLMDEIAGGSSSTLEIKKAELVIADLVNVVKHSKLGSRDLIGDLLVGIAEDARKSARGLQRFNSKVRGAVDQLIAVNEYAMKSIWASQSSTFSIVPIHFGAFNNGAILKTFMKSMEVLSTNLRRLVLEAEINLVSLDALEERLSVLHDVVTREDSALSSAKSKLLAELWTKLGGNRHMLSDYSDQLAQLNAVYEYRKQALARVSSVLLTLTGLSDDLEVLREQVAQPELSGSQMPMEVHMRSLWIGAHRLVASMDKGRTQDKEAYDLGRGIA